MSAVPLRNNKAATAVRSVTVLGATGSIGDSTMDLLRASTRSLPRRGVDGDIPMCKALANLAREFGARYVAVADPTRLSELKDALAGTRTECGAGESAVVEAAARPADWVMAAVSGAAGLKPALAAVDRGATVALANKECLVCAGDLFMERATKAGACILPADSEHNALFQALEFRKSRRTGSRHHHRIRRAVPYLVQRRHRAGNAGAGPETSELEHGAEDHDRFGIDDEQRPRGDRGGVPVRSCGRRDRRPGSSAIDHSRHGRILGSLRGGAVGRAGYAHADRALPGLARPNCRVRRRNSISPRSGS